MYNVPGTGYNNISRRWLMEHSLSLPIDTGKQKHEHGLLPVTSFTVLPVYDVEERWTIKAYAGVHAERSATSGSSYHIHYIIQVNYIDDTRKVFNTESKSMPGI